ncbi:MAG: spermidine synthase [Candidatus Azotimanducaceae bacterium]
MNKWEQLDTAEIPAGGELRLLRRGSEFSIRIAGMQGDLMNSRTHGSEDALGVMGCETISTAQSASVLVGGLGMGFTLAATLASLHENAKVVVAELIPGVVKWNQEVLGECAGHPLADKRVQVIVSDVAELISRAVGEYDAILLDVDNGPEGLTQDENDDLYSLMGLEEAYHALRPSGVLAVWSAGPSPQFNSLLQKAGFRVDERHVRAHNGRGARHIIWLAKRD